jgi:lipopolysaccharide heptosyltransferase II
MLTRLWIMDKDRWKHPGRLHRSLAEIVRFGRGLRRARFDVSIDLSGLLRSGLVTWAAGARERLGFSDSDEGSPFFYNRKIVGGDAIHAIDRYLKLARLMDCDVAGIHYPMAPLPDSTPLLDSLPEEFCVITPSAGKKANRWPAERFGALAASLPLPSVIVGGKSDTSVAETVVQHGGGQATSMAGKTGLKELVTLIGRARFMVCNDTGPMHIAAALGVPVFAIFGPANPVRTGPYGEIHTVIQRNMDCAPCYRWQPCDHWQCMLDLSVQEVASIIATSLEKGLPGPGKKQDNQ